MVEHRCARARWADDGLAVVLLQLLMKQTDRSAADRFGLASMTRVQRRLAAAGLTVVKEDFAAASLEHLDGGQSGGGPELVDQTTCEETNFHRVPE